MITRRQSQTSSLARSHLHHPSCSCTSLPAVHNTMAKDHPPPSGLRTLAFLVAEIAIIVCLGVTVVFIVKHPGPLKEVSAISLYANYDWHAVVCRHHSWAHTRSIGVIGCRS